MGTYLWLRSLKTNGENIIKCMVFIVFSSAIFLHWCLFFAWSKHIGKGPTTKSLVSELNRAFIVKAHLVV